MDDEIVPRETAREVFGRIALLYGWRITHVQRCGIAHMEKGEGLRARRLVLDINDSPDKLIAEFKYDNDRHP
jgi:hypothetical protein